MIYSTQLIQEKIIPFAIAYDLPAVYLFGSYARDEAQDDSDIDILIEDVGSAIDSLMDLSSLQSDLEDALGKKVSLVTVESLERQSHGVSWRFARNVVREAVCIYERTR